MKKRILPALLLCASLQAQTMGTLFEALKQNPSIKLDDLAVMKSKVGYRDVMARFYPKVDALVGFDHYNRPSSLVPLPPNKILPMVKDPTVAQPFGTTIKRAGVSVSMPLFVKSLFTQLKRSELLQHSAKERKKLAFLQKEALLVGAIANWHYLIRMQESLATKEKSLQKSMQVVRLKVKTGRAPESAMFKLEEAVDSIEIAKNNLKIQVEQIKATIYQLTAIALKKPVQIHQSNKIKEEKLFALEPLKDKADADALALKAQKEQLWPSLVAKGSYFSNQTDAYNNDKSVREGYGSYGIYLKVPLFNKSNYTQIDQAKLSYLKSRTKIAKATLELKADAQRLKATLPLLEHSIKVAKRSAQNREKLLKIARVSFKNERMSEEEYLRYEDARSDAQAKVAALVAKRWQTFVQLAVIYGNNLKGIVK